MEPPAINNDEFNDEADEDASLLPQSVEQHRHHGRTRAFSGFLGCMSGECQSESGSSFSAASETDHDSAEFQPVSKEKNGCCHKAKSGFGKFLANIFVSVTLIVLIIALCLGLGAFALFKVEPKPVIDKSVKSFTIPNHNATKKQDAFEQAQSELSLLLRNWYKRKQRDLSSFADFSLDNIEEDVRKLEVKALESTLDKHENIGADIMFPNSESIPSPDLQEDGSLQNIKEDIRKLDTDNLGSMLGKHENIKEDVMDPDSESIPSPDLQDDGNIHSSLKDVAGSHRTKRQIRDPNLYIPNYTQSVRRWKMQVVYLAQGTSEDGPENDHNIFTKQRLQDIHDIEMKIMRHKGFMEFCHIDYMSLQQDSNLNMFSGCAPLNSLMTYFYPSMTAGNVSLYSLMTYFYPSMTAGNVSLYSLMTYFYLSMTAGNISLNSLMTCFYPSMAADNVSLL